MDNNTLAKQFNGTGLIKYAVPTVVMMVFMSVYGIVDGIFVANFVNEHALAATNIIMPLVGVFLALGLMVATGSNALIARLLGVGDHKKAREIFSFIYLFGTILGIVFTLIAFVFADDLVRMIGASDILFPYAKSYLVTIMPFATFGMLQVFTQSFFVTIGKPILGFVSCVLGGVANIVFDYVFIVPMDLGIVGAALATGIGFSIPGLFGVIYFAVNKKSDLYFVKPKCEIREFFKCMHNGLSEFVTSISSSITMLLCNIILMNIAGENGVAAITVIMYIHAIQSAVYMGYAMGVSPIISYKYGSGDKNQLHLVNKLSLIFIAVLSVIVVSLSLIFAEQAAGLFISETSETFSMVVDGLRIYAVGFIFIGFNIYGSSMFTALSNGTVSAFISFMRTLVFIVIALLVLPIFLGVNGVWIAVPLAEILAIFITIWCMKKNKQKYGY